MTTCAYCGHDTIDAHQIEVCASCCSCREDLAGEVLAIADGVADIAKRFRRTLEDVTRISGLSMEVPNTDIGWLHLHSLALTQLAARLSRTGEAVRDE